MKIITTGGRTFPESRIADIDAAFMKVLRMFPDNTIDDLIVVHGAAKSGADLFVNTWCEIQQQHGNNVTIERYPADWAKYNLGAGPIRNSLMVEENQDADIGLAFWNGSTHRSGTWDCMNKLSHHGINTYITWY